MNEIAQENANQLLHGNRFDHIRIQLASPEKIRSWSYGEIKKPETINYRTLRPERDGLFCERIFGTTKEWECYCGKFKSIRYKGVICDRCGVEVTHPKVRRERMGHIELATSVSHIWYYRNVPSRIGLLLDLPLGALRSVLYYEKYIVVDSGNTDLEKMTLLTEEEYMIAQERYGASFSASIGAEAIKILLEQINLEQIALSLRKQMLEKGNKTDIRVLKRIEIVEQFRSSSSRPEWMILDVIPVIPPELRPMVQLDGGRFATSDLNDLYRRIINRNNRLKRLVALGAPDIIIRNEKRMLQEAVDALFDNSKKKKAVKGSSNRPLKSLSDILRGKQGRFRQNLLGKRVDYSGRSVIVVGPELKLYQCGLPVQMALELFKPFIIRKLVEKEVVFNIKRAKTLVEQEDDEIWPILDEVIKQHPVLLNRAPTLHRLGIQAFEVVLVEGRAIRLHPLVCHAYNADFDGDQMAVHVPLSQAAQLECWTLMLSAKNLLNPANGQAIVFPLHEMVLGIHALTSVKENVLGQGKYFGDINEMYAAIDQNLLHYNALITVNTPKGVQQTTAGRVILNEALPKDFPYIDEVLNEKGLRRLIEQVYNRFDTYTVVQLLDTIKDLGFKYATIFGCTIGMDDIVIPTEKKILLDKANKQVENIRQQYLSGIITGEERYNRIISVWSKANDELTDTMMDVLSVDQKGFNNVFVMYESGARGSRNQIRQLAGMRGLMARPSGDIIELPIKSNFREGLSVIEFFISTNGARKGLADTALKTADAGYLTRRLVDIAHDIVVSEEDCGTINGISMQAIHRGEEVVETLKNRIEGLFTLEPVYHPITGEVLLGTNQEITNEMAEQIDQIGIQQVYVRTVFTCESERGVCRKCYGRNLASGNFVNIGEAVGIIAAQSIGQPGTQLTMRTFHVGGVAETGNQDNQIQFPFSIYLVHLQTSSVKNKQGQIVSTKKGKMYYHKVLHEYDLTQKEALVKDQDRVNGGEAVIRVKDQVERADTPAIVRIIGKKMYLVGQENSIDIPNGSSILSEEGKIYPAGQVLTQHDPFSEPIIAEKSGFVKFIDIVENLTLYSEVNVDTGLIEKRIEGHSVKSMDPTVCLVDEEGEVLETYILSAGTYLNIEDGQKIEAGDVLAKISKGSEKTQDITGGLPRVGELFEARRPKNGCVLAKVKGKVMLKPLKKDRRTIQIEDEFGDVYSHVVEANKRLLVRNGDYVHAGEPLCSGNIDPHDILDVLGENALQSFLLNEVQEVYRRQGVNINDKHIGIIIKQMMRKVQVVEVGDTNCIYGQQVNKIEFRKKNEQILAQGGIPAVAKPLLLGITRASLSINSFISAASFQETTKILTNAAIISSVDHLYGLKENVIVGQLIPAGTGMLSYKKNFIEMTSRENLEQNDNNA